MSNLYYRNIEKARKRRAIYYDGVNDEYDYFPHETTEQAIQAAQAHHDTQVLALLNLPQ